MTGHRWDNAAQITATIKTKSPGRKKRQKRDSREKEKKKAKKRQKKRQNNVASRTCYKR
jgi:hypothetical protein